MVAAPGSGPGGAAFWASPPQQAFSAPYRRHGIADTLIPSDSTLSYLSLLRWFCDLNNFVSVASLPAHHTHLGTTYMRESRCSALRLRLFRIATAAFFGLLTTGVTLFLACYLFQANYRLHDTLCDTPSLPFAFGDIISRCGTNEARPTKLWDGEIEKTRSITLPLGLTSLWFEFVSTVFYILFPSFREKDVDGHVIFSVRQKSWW